MNTATFSMAMLAPALPEILLALLASALLIGDLFVPERNRHLTYWLAIVAVLVAAGGCVATIKQPRSVTFGGMFILDPMSQVLKVATLLTVAATMVLSRSYLVARGMLTGEILA